MPEMPLQQSSEDADRQGRGHPCCPEACATSAQDPVETRSGHEHSRLCRSSIFRPGREALADETNGQTVKTVQPLRLHGSLELRTEGLHQPDAKARAFGLRLPGVDRVLNAERDDVLAAFVIA